MSCFLLRDGRTLSLELMVEANKVFTYVDQQGRCVHALLSAAAERELLARVPVALDESLRDHPAWRAYWPGWQVRRPALEGDPRLLLRQLQQGTPHLMLSTAFETGIGARWLAHLAALQQLGPTPAAPGLAPGWCPETALFSSDPEEVWIAAGDAR